MRTARRDSPAAASQVHACQEKMWVFGFSVSRFQIHPEPRLSKQKKEIAQQTLRNRRVRCPQPKGPKTMTHLAAAVQPFMIGQQRLGGGRCA